MKTFIILLALLAAGSTKGQSGPVGQEFKTSSPNLADQALGLKPPLKPNEIAGTRSNVTYSGIIPEAVKSDNTLQLINPLAPPEYGFGEQNLSLDITPRHAPGLKLISVNF
jgi:hypothetical protein